jgi:hypothetical protein
MRYVRITFVAALIGIGAAGAAQSRFQAAAPPAGRGRIPSQCIGLTMHLEPGALRPDGSPWPSWAIARDMPLDPVTVQVPLYPGAAASRAPLAKNIYFSVTASRYLKMAVAEFSVPSGTSHALRWYRKSFAACGFTTREHSTNAVVFASPTTASLEAAVAVQGVSSRSSLILYYAEAVSPPLRPPGSLVPDTLCGGPCGPSVPRRDVQKFVQVTYAFPVHTFGNPRSRPQLGWRIKLVNRADIHALANVIDTPATIDASMHSCAGNFGGATLRFTSAAGKHTRVVVNPDCFDFSVNGSRGIVDDNHGVFSFVEFLVYKHCVEYHCRPVKL